MPAMPTLTVPRPTLTVPRLLAVPEGHDPQLSTLNPQWTRKWKLFRVQGQRDLVGRLIMGIAGRRTYMSIRFVGVYILLGPADP